MTPVRTAAGINKAEDIGRKDTKPGSSMRCGESFRQRCPAISHFVGWVPQEARCDRMSVIFDLRQQGGISNCRLSGFAITCSYDPQKRLVSLFEWLCFVETPTWN